MPQTPDQSKAPASSPSQVGPAPSKAPAAATPPSSSESSRSSLEAQAETLEAKAEDAQAQADELADEAAKAARDAAEVGLPRAAHCPICKGRLERYTGGDINPHKVGTHWCINCGRMRL